MGLLFFSFFLISQCKMPVDILHLVAEPFFNYFFIFLKRTQEIMGLEEESEVCPCSEMYVEYELVA